MPKKNKLQFKNPDTYSYLQVLLEFDEQSRSDITKDVFAYIIYSAVKTLHGEVAAAEPIDVLEFDQDKLQATLRCTKKSIEKVWSALTLYGSYNQQRCLFHVAKISSPEVEKESSGFIDVNLNDDDNQED